MRETATALSLVIGGIALLVIMPQPVLLAGAWAITAVSLFSLISVFTVPVLATAGLIFLL